MTRIGDEKSFHLDLKKKKKLFVWEWTKSNLDVALLKSFWFQISAIIYRQQPLSLHLQSLIFAVLSVWILTCLFIKKIYYFAYYVYDAV